jgi:hypothetical protein
MRRCRLADRVSDARHSSIDWHGVQVFIVDEYQDEGDEDRARPPAYSLS